MPSPTEVWLEYASADLDAAERLMQSPDPTMAQDTGVIFRRDVVDHFIDVISREVRVDGVLLFGSFAYGIPTKHSDVDLAVISPDFQNMEFWDRAGWLSQKRDKPTYQIAMDVIGYTPEEF